MAGPYLRVRGELGAVGEGVRGSHIWFALELMDSQGPASGWSGGLCLGRDLGSSFGRSVSCV